MGVPSPPDLLVLHAVRVSGMADGASVAARFGLAREVVEGLLLDDEAHGWVRRVQFADLAGWALTQAGRAEDERRLADELARTGTRGAVSAAHDEFVQLNERFLTTVTNWQIRPEPWDAMAANNHTDWRWDERVLDELVSHRRRLEPVCRDLTDALERFAGYDVRFGAAVDRAHKGQRSWVDQTGIDSCHIVWVQLHEDLLATLGRERGDDR